MLNLVYAGLKALVWIAVFLLLFSVVIAVSVLVGVLGAFLEACAPNLWWVKAGVEMLWVLFLSLPFCGYCYWLGKQAAVKAQEANSHLNK